ncbi:uncharacterized protein FPRO_06658 [Fusarium proliferatum ET1]|uniref:Uncharacterized protein n=1 Tax=Fusarium proliferatum (strain ET1) TaxID=1227346 RepID=A0A1L7VBS1_FUSPR|nr:uncharacterized protein FPRO_06658 [Fusarium proliferatum ET1]CZR38151.1 uncharacterized protein FPRO_06658 [Fusarium proliferatum ET1]
MNHDQGRGFMYRIIRQVVHVKISGMGVVTRQFDHIASNLAILVYSQVATDSHWQSFPPTPANHLYPIRHVFSRLAKESLMPTKFISKVRGWLDKIYQIYRKVPVLCRSGRMLLLEWDAEQKVSPAGLPDCSTTTHARPSPDSATLWKYTKWPENSSKMKLVDSGHGSFDSCLHRATRLYPASAANTELCF